MAEPILFNTINSSFDVSHSIIGINGVETGSPSYVAAMFENGIDVDANGKYIDFAFVPSNIIGTMACWFKPHYNAASPPAYDAQIIGYQGVGDRFSLDHFFTPSSRFRVVFPISGGGVNVIFATTSFSADDLIHLAMTWNSSGIDGTSDTIRLYVNGIDVASAITALGTTSQTHVRLGNHGGNNRYADGVIDNFKAYNYDKIDFSDRFNERGGMNDQTILI